MSDRLIGIGLILLAGALLFTLVKALRQGVTFDEGTEVRRDQRPGCFWTILLVVVVGMIASGWGGIAYLLAGR